MAPTQLPRSWSTRNPKTELALWTLFSQKLKSQGNPTPLAHLATIHYQTHGRSLRIALDQDSWNYGLTRTQERSIQRSQRKAFKKHQRKERSQIWCKKYSPSQKLRLFHREINVLTRLMGYIALGIEFYVILPSPLQREDVGEMGDRYAHANGKMHIWFRVLGDLGVRFHAAGNTVVECVHMMEEGVVDVVWTNNPDALVYCGGRGVVVRDSEGAKGPSFEDVRVYRMEEVRRGVSWRESVVVHTLVRSGCGIEDMDKFVQDMLIEGVLNLCERSSQEEVDEWLQQYIAPFFNLNSSNEPKYHILENYLIHSVSNDSTESQFFRQRCHSRMREIKDTHADALAFYNSNLTDRVRRLWEYSRDTFSTEAIQFLGLMAGVLLARRFGGGNLSSDSTIPIEEAVSSIDPWTVKVLIKVEEEPVLWNLRIKMTEDLTGMVLNPVMLKILVSDVGNDSTTPRSKEDTSILKLNSKRRGRIR
ncbi:uncharacterized protein DFL_008423 [Arthrobotrys flagrans]|uniref:XPG-I domain-containing protein n=1 Tax=Arthrobotrys flagrans TaxID=97331 RepID=A0A436ZNP4_ARTFL|nr:hypothetical protein DFL_008423 [Arthrobotrys flagrans]